jgi:hypothetical protein
MNTSILVIGESGTGKTRSLRNLPPSKTVIHNYGDKPLSIPGFRNDYKANVNLFNYPMPVNYEQWMANKSQLFSRIQSLKNNPTVKFLVIDDAQYFMSFHFLSRAGESGYQKFSELADQTKELLRVCRSVRPDIVVIMLWHETNVGTETKPYFRAMTCGKLIDEKLRIEGLFTYVVRSVLDPMNWDYDRGYCFEVHSSISSVKVPPEVFDEDDVLAIPNDLYYLAYNILQYEKGGQVKSLEEWFEKFPHYEEARRLRRKNAETPPPSEPDKQPPVE